MVIVSQQYFLYRLAILIPITTDSIPATARHPPQISILIIQYTTPAMTRLDNPLLICAASFPVCIIQPAMVCVNVAIASKNTISAKTSMLHTRLFLLYICLPVFLSAYHTFPWLSDKLSGYSSHTFDRVPAFQPVSLLFSDGRVHSPVPVLPALAYLDIPLSCPLR